MKKMINNCTIAGFLYQLCDANGKQPLSVKTVANPQSENYGKEFINGTVAVMVDNEGLNVVDVHYSYVTPTTKKGEVNNTFVTLKKLIEEGKTYLEHGADATMVKLEPSLDINDFVNREGAITSAKRLEGGFASIVNVLPKEEERNTFKTDILINRVTLKEADPEHNINEDYCVVGGAVFNFRGELLPVEYIIKNPSGMDYFQSLGATQNNIVFTKVWGRINCITKVVEIKEESAFGEPSVRTYTNKIREYLITGANPEAYPIDDPATITFADIQKAQQNREIHLAEVRKNDEEYKANKNNSSIATAFNAAPEKTATISIPVGSNFTF